MAITYGDNLMAIEPANSPGCIAQAYTLQLVHLSAGMWAVCLMTMLWLLIVKGASDVQLKLFKIYIIFACCIPSLLTLVAFAVHYRQYAYNVSSHTYHCYVRYGLVTLLTRYIPYLLCMVIGICFGVHAAWNLITYRQKFERENSFKSMAIPVGLCIRVIMFCVLLFLMTSIQPIVKFSYRLTPLYRPPSKIEQGISAYTSTVVTFGLFIIFGTTREALRMRLGSCNICNFFRNGRDNFRKKISRDTMSKDSVCTSTIVSTPPPLTILLDSPPAHPLPIHSSPRKSYHQPRSQHRRLLQFSNSLQTLQLHQNLPPPQFPPPSDPLPHIPSPPTRIAFSFSLAYKFPYARSCMQLARPDSPPSSDEELSMHLI
ncbi:10955_t:CDS:2 [Paraglomus brasilianum]|uniref:10955_t:CDS:1 n=1 Tax=Paraglomus brasilianum TaxID=144538 RepID=A0A9N9ABN1_9GLOM|nr:10955_t:CDS:2 [Paraglomus brasilianum]